MESVQLIASSVVGLKELSDIIRGTFSNCQIQIDDSTLWLSADGQDVVIKRSDKSTEVYSDQEANLILETVGDPMWLLIEWRGDINVVRLLVHSVCSKYAAIFDDEMNGLMLGAEFVARVAQRPDWDWRTKA